MKQNISTLMDGELCDEEAGIILDKIKKHSESWQDWSAYHLIGDSLRQPDFVSKDISETVFKRLQAEPTVLAPRSKRENSVSYFAMSAVASIMAVAFLAWLSVQLDAGPLHQQSRQAAGDAPIAHWPANDMVNDYLLAHQEFSPSSDVRGAASYIRAVAYKQPVAGN
jgi:sigma-E factor negative regulatory protein RseA